MPTSIGHASSSENISVEVHVNPDQKIEDNSDVLSVADVAPAPQHLNYKQTAFIRESHGKSIFGVAFNSTNKSRPTDPLLFATVGGIHITVYQCNDIGENESLGGTPVVLLQSFADPATGEDAEDFYCCAWSRNLDSTDDSDDTSAARRSACSQQQVLAVAGKRGVIRLLCPSLASCMASLVGHGQAVNELKFHPRHPALLLSFSKDYTVRLWNISTRVVVAIFGGAEGHRAEVLYGDVSLTGDYLLSASMDHTIKIWRLNTPELESTVKESFKTVRPDPFPTVQSNFPEFSSRDAHGNYVDCARWFGDLVISKSCENCLVVWKPGPLDRPLSRCLPSRLSAIDQRARCMAGVPLETRCSILHHLKVPDCQLWYIRFDIELGSRLIALGTGTGAPRIFLWDLTQLPDAFTLTPKVLQVTASGSAGQTNFGAIRQTRFANDGRTLLAVGDNGLVVRFDRIPSPPSVRW